MYCIVFSHQRRRLLYNYRTDTEHNILAPAFMPSVIQVTPTSKSSPLLCPQDSLRRSQTSEDPVAVIPVNQLCVFALMRTSLLGHAGIIFGISGISYRYCEHTATELYGPGTAVGGTCQALLMFLCLEETLPPENRKRFSMRKSSPWRQMLAFFDHR